MLHIKVLNTLVNAGYESYLVGGCVRNEILGLEVKDYDICTAATPTQVCALFEDFDLVGAHFGIVIVKEDGKFIEVATFRTDEAYTNGRHPDEVKYTTNINEDLARRDFTINTILKDKNGQIIDKLNGQKDLIDKKIVCVGEPDARFQEDALRILRAIRFAVTLDFKIPQETWTAIRNNVHRLELLSTERVIEEFNKILLADAGKGFVLMAKLGVFEHVLTELSVENMVWEKYNDLFNSLTHLNPKRKTISAYLTILIAYSYIKDPPAFLQKYKYSNDVISAVSANVQALFTFADMNKASSKADMKRFIRLKNFNEILDIDIALNPTSNSERMPIYFAAIKYNDEDLWPVPLLSGDILIANGYTPGPDFKKWLYIVETAQLNGEISTIEEALNLINKG